mgnify:CR=1 FL=1
MSEMQERAKRLIAEAHALMAKARADVKRVREVMASTGINPASIPVQFNKAFGDKGPEVMEQMLQEQLQAAREAMRRDVQPTEQPAARVKKLRRMV